MIEEERKVKFVQITKDEYDELEEKSLDTLYFIFNENSVSMSLGDNVILEDTYISDFEIDGTFLKLKKSNSELEIPFKTINNQSILGTGDVTVTKEKVFLVSKGFDEETQTLTVEEV